MTNRAEIDDDELLDGCHACPGCGQYYTLSITAPPLPFYLANYGTYEEIDAWEAENDHNISQCAACGWRSDEDA